MDEFNELAGRLEGIARAVILLTATMERETCMDGLTLTNQWRESIPAPPRSTGTLLVAHRTLQELAQQVDAARTRHQSQVAQWRAEQEKGPIDGPV